MTGISPDVTAVLLSAGLTEVHERITNDGAVVQQDATMPPRLRRALALVSGLCIEAGVEDKGASVHVAMELALEPLKDWGLPQFEPPFRYADAILIDGDLGVPTPDCREMAASGGAETLIQEELQHEALRSELLTLPARQRDGAYTAIREFVVRNPAVAFAERESFIIENDLFPFARLIASFYRPIPQSALFGRAARRCAHCGSLLWPHRDLASYPDGRCRIRQCRAAMPAIRRGNDILEPAAWQLATPASLAYWVGPGLDEIRIYDALRAAGRDVALYPLGDAADVGVDGLETGIDVKSYASPLLLGQRLTRSLGRLPSFRRRILAVPDDKLTVNRHYLGQLLASYGGATPLEFMTASDVIRELAR